MTPIVPENHTFMVSIVALPAQLALRATSVALNQGPNSAIFNFRSLVIVFHHSTKFQHCPSQGKKVCRIIKYFFCFPDSDGPVNQFCALVPDQYAPATKMPDISFSKMALIKIKPAMTTMTSPKKVWKMNSKIGMSY